jgi:hypothetical protein
MWSSAYIELHLVVDDESRSRDGLGVTRCYHNGENKKKWTARGEDTHEANPVPSGEHEGISTLESKARATIV